MFSSDKASLTTCSSPLQANEAQSSLAGANANLAARNREIDQLRVELRAAQHRAQNAEQKYLTAASDDEVRPRALCCVSLSFEGLGFRGAVALDTRVRG